MTKKYFFFDVDGTLTNIHTGELISSAIETIKKLQDQGHFVAICTGRAHYKTVGVAKKCGIANFVSNGGACLTIDNQMVKNTPLDKHLALKLIQEARLQNLGLLVSYDDSIDVFMKDDLFFKQAGLRQEPTRYFLNKNKEFEELENIFKIYIASTKEDEQFLPTLKQLGYIRFVNEYLTIQHDKKDQGIVDMIHYLHGNLEDVVVFGDGDNDLVMFHKPYFSIAMGNGYPELLEKADFVTKASYEDGIQYACQHFGWIK